MKNTKADKRVKLDWSRLLGFNQVQSAQSAKGTLSAKIGAKVGVKGPPAQL